MRTQSTTLMLLLVAACAPASDTGPPEALSQPDWAPQIREANEALLNQGDLDRIPDFFAESYISHGDGAGTQGHEAIRGFLEAMAVAFPDLEVDVEILVTEGDRVAWIRNHRGTHQGEFMGIPGTGRVLTWQDMVVTRYEGDMIAEEWGVSGLAGVIQSP
jgi:predicted ester cyclase